MAGFPEGGESGFVRLFALSAEGLRMGAWWQPLTYAVLHGSWAHLLANVFGLAVTGACLEHVLGARRLMGVVAVGAAFGAVGFLASLALDARLSGGASCVGASACLAACLGAVTGLAPRARVTLWVTVLPVPIRAWWLMPLFVAYAVTEAWAWPQVTAYGAHVGGWLAGVVYGAVAARALRPAPPCA